MIQQPFTKEFFEKWRSDADDICKHYLQHGSIPVICDITGRLLMSLSNLWWLPKCAKKWKIIVLLQLPTKTSSESALNTSNRFSWQRRTTQIPGDLKNPSELREWCFQSWGDLTFSKKVLESRSKPIIFHCFSTDDGFSPRNFSVRVLLVINIAGIDSRDT